MFKLDYDMNLSGNFDSVGYVKWSCYYTEFFRYDPII